MKSSRSGIVRRDILKSPAIYAPLAGGVAAGGTQAAPGTGVSNEAWPQYLLELSKSAWVFQHPETPKDPMSVATGLTNLHRLSQLAWELAFEYADHEAPKLFPVSVRNLSHGYNSSNATYLVAVIDGARSYRLTGFRGQAPFMEIGVYDNLDGFGLVGGGRRISSVDESELVVDGNGRFAIEIGPDVKASPSLRTEPGENVVFIRQYAHDWRETPASRGIYIEPIGNIPQSMTYPDSVSEGLRKAPQYLQSHLKIYHRLMTENRRRGRNMMFDVPRNNAATLPKGHHYVAGNFDLAVDDVLVIEFTPEDAPYWSIELGDFWGQTLDYDRTLDAEVRVPYDAPATGSHLHNRQIKLGENGVARVLVSAGPRPSEQWNWLDAKGLKVGFIVYRQFRKIDRMPHFSTRVAKREEVAKY